jgi:two-component system, probable response regulator PhcQ
MARHTVLFVDDDPNVLTGLRVALWQTDYITLLAENPTEALALLQQQAVDVIISDHMMPGMNGLEFLKLARDRRPDCVRIMLTGHADKEMAIEAINDGEIYRFLIKPIDRTELLVTLHLACEKLELERENRRLLALLRNNSELSTRLSEPEPTGDLRPAAGKTASRRR